jgi:phage baseplate assembly protein V
LTRAEELSRKIRNLVSRGVIKRVSYDGKIRRMQVTLRKDFPLDGLEHLEPYGYTSHPLPGGGVVVVSSGGNRGRTYILMAHDRRHRLMIEEGETAIYTHNGDKVHIKADGTIHHKASLKVIMETPLEELTGDLHILKGLIVDEISKALDHVSDGVSGKNHDHDYVTSSGSTVKTSKPNPEPSP